jgi:hypothetical protein
VSKSALLCPTSTTEVASVTADLDTRCGELYRSGDEVLPCGQRLTAKMQPPAGAPAVTRRASRLARMRLPQAGGSLSRWSASLMGADAACLSHAELEEHLDVHGRELLRCLP